MSSDHSAVAVGTFDGIHRGHRLLIDSLIYLAKKKGLKSVLIVLSRPVRHVSGLLTLPDEKLYLLKEFQLDKIIEIDPDSKIIGWNREKFLSEFISKKNKGKYIVCGRNISFGHGLKGDLAWLRTNAPKHGISLSVVDYAQYHGFPVSSTRIRNALHCGRVAYAEKLLARNYSFTGARQGGKELGRKLGFPTINLKVDKSKILPLGVYASLAKVGKKIFPSVTNIGRRPTFLKDGEIVPEIHIINSNQEITIGEKVSITLLKHIRNEKRFKNESELKENIQKDCKKALSSIYLHCTKKMI